MSALFVMIVIAFLAWLTFTQVQARKHTILHTPLGKLQVQEAIDKTFDSMWTRTAGPGHVNVKPKLRSHAPTISISVESGNQSGCDVDIWMSRWVTRYGVAGHAQLVWRKKLSLGSALQASPSGSMGAATALRTPPTFTTSPSAQPDPAKTPFYGAQSANGSTRASSVVINTVQGTDTNFVLRTKRPAREVAAALGAAIQSTQPGSANHLVLGPPRATMWAHLQELPSGETLMTLSLMTLHNADQEYVRESIRRPLETIVAPSVEGSVSVLDGHGIPGALQHDLQRGRLVPVAELAL